MGSRVGFNEKLKMHPKHLLEALDHKEKFYSSLKRMLNLAFNAISCRHSSNLNLCSATLAFFF